MHKTILTEDIDARDLLGGVDANVIKIMLQISEK